MSALRHPLAFVLAACILPCLAVAAAGQSFIFGVGTHFAFPPQPRAYFPVTMRPLLAELKVDSFRDDVSQDFFGVPEPGLPLGRGDERLTAMLVEKSHRPVLILHGRRPPPSNAAELALYTVFATRLVASTLGLNPIYEIDNELNTSWRKRDPVKNAVGIYDENPAYSPESYVKIAAASHAAIKGRHGAATVLTGAIGDDDGWEWTRRALKAGLAATGDGISVHLYNHCASPGRRTAEELIDRLEGFRRLVVAEAGSRAPPIYVTEFGWPNDTGPCGIPLAAAAANIAQFALWAPTVNWLKGIWLYELHDSGTNTAEREDNFGLYTNDNRPKPAACAYREAIALARSMTGAAFRTAPSGIRWLAGQDAGGKAIWVFWTTAADGKGSVKARSGEELSARPLCGTGETVRALSHELGTLPVVVYPGDGAIAIDLGLAGR